ncbi:unnamed protein product [Camellia sinensis]
MIIIVLSNAIGAGNFTINVGPVSSIVISNKLNGVNILKVICWMLLRRYRYRPASPTTLGKEIAIFAVRLSRERRDISQVEIMGKFVGVVRNYNAHLVAYPDIKWRQIAEEFMKSLGLSFNPCVTLIIKSVLDPCEDENDDIQDDDIAKIVDEVLDEQGGKRLVPVGLGDDDQCMEDDFAAWRELLWRELDQLLKDDDSSTVATPYTAAVLEYRVVYHDGTDASILDKSMSNGHAFHDAQHPCRSNDQPSNVPPAILLRFLREHRSEWADSSIDAYSAAAVKVGLCSLPGSRVGSFSGQVILPLAHTIEHEELLEVIKLEGVGHCPEDAIMPRDMFLLQLWSGMDENAVGTCAELIFAPIDASFADDAPLLPSGFRIIPLDSGKEASSPNRTLDLASALEIGPAGNKASNDYTSNGGSTRSVMTIAFEFAFEVCYLGVELLKSGSEGSETTLKTLWHHTDAIMCCSLKALPVFTFANQAGLDMLETTLVALQDITLEKIFDDHGRKTLCSEFPQIMQQKKMVELVHKIIEAKRKNRGRSEVAKDVADVLLNDASEELNDYLILDVFNIISHISVLFIPS